MVPVIHTPASTPISVLFVDDNEMNRYAGARMLRVAGYKVLEAANGAEALLALEQKPDIAVVDVHLPDVDGFTLCQQIKSHPANSNLPVLLMSAAFISTEDRVQGLEGGADGYLVQPFELPVLRATITATLRMREAEEQARKLSQQWQVTFDAISDGIWILDEQGRITQGNSAMAQLWNTEVAQLQGAFAWDIIQNSGLLHETHFNSDFGDTLYSSPASVLESLVKNAVAAQKEHEIGVQGRWFRVVSHLESTEANASSVVQVWNDITHRKQAEQERLLLLEREKVARLQAEEANRLKDEFLATLSHELRTPLMAIIGWAGLLKEESMSPEEIRDGLTVIERNARSQSQIINDLLDVSRVIAGKMQLRMESVDLHAVLQNALTSVQPSLEAKHITLAHSTDARCRIIGDADRLQQVLWNLLSNAVKFTPPGGTIEVKCHSTGNAVVLEVTDSGQGIDAKFLPYVFDRFRQADSSSTRRHGGLGLGLAIVRHLTEMHGGQAKVTSPGQGLGTTFTLTFPFTRQQEASQPHTPAAEITPNTPPLQGLRIQVVDDQEETRLLLAALLNHRGAEVQCSANAQEAMNSIQQWLPDLLISDLGMPGEDGYSLIQRVRTLPPESGGLVPALALSAYADALHRQKALESGFHVFAAKPIEPTDLINILLNLASEEGIKRS